MASDSADSGFGSSRRKAEAPRIRSPTRICGHASPPREPSIRECIRDWLNRWRLRQAMRRLCGRPLRDDSRRAACFHDDRLLTRGRQFFTLPCVIELWMRRSARSCERSRRGRVWESADCGGRVGASIRLRLRVESAFPGVLLRKRWPLPLVCTTCAASRAQCSAPLPLRTSRDFWRSRGRAARGDGQFRWFCVNECSGLSDSTALKQSNFSLMLCTQLKFYSYFDTNDATIDCPTDCSQNRRYFTIWND